MDSAPRRLPLVPRELELSGKTSPELERFVRGASLGSAAHNGILFAISTVARSAAAKTVPPSLLAVLIAPLANLDANAPAKTGPTALASGAKHLLSALPELEAQTIRAVVSAGEESALGSPTGADEATWLALHAHRASVLRRYVSLSVNLAAEAVFSVIDSVADPTRALDVIANVAASRAYQQVALGSLRFRAFLERAFRQASWDAARPTSLSLGQDIGLLAPQILHEFLGARFRAYAQSEQANVEEFMAFACSGPAPSVASRGRPA